jgi:hypothetical protein
MDASPSPADQPDLDLALSGMGAKAVELHEWYRTLQAAGFSELQAYGLLPTMILTGIIRREPQ